MTIIDDLNRPLPDVENVILRRVVTIFLSIIIIPLAMLYGICKAAEWFINNWIKPCW